MFFPFDPQPSNEESPQIFPSPFRPGEPHPLAHRAARELQLAISTHSFIRDGMFHGDLGGKMLGVLVARDAKGRLGYLRAFAGTLGGKRELEGFAPPTFEVEAFEALWAVGGDAIAELDREIVALRQGDADEPETLALRQLKMREQRELSRALHLKLLETYKIRNAKGEGVALAELFDVHIPPGGAGDCAAPKLLLRAYALGLEPIALAEFWWGGAPPAGGRQHGVYYPACRGRCAKILPFMLQGIECEAPPDVGMKAVSDSAPDLIYEDEHLLVVDKPCGLLSVPGRGSRRQDSVERRLQERLALEDPTWPRVVHRLDVATSGLMIAAKNKAVYVGLQRQFSAKDVDKRYVALLQGVLQMDEGVVDIPLGRDLDDRPRQMHDPVRGKASVTAWEVLGRYEETTRVAFYPKTGRTHQLRLHAAHEAGLGAPIVGDWLYGFGGERLMLHAESISFRHPLTQAELRFSSPCPF